MHSRDSADRPQASSPTDRAAQQPETDVERNLGVLVADVSLLLNRYFNRQARTLELTTPQWQVLSQLYRHDDLTQTELAETLNMAKSPLGKLVDKLEAAGWVRRETDPRDRRIKRIRLTARIDPFVEPLLAVSNEMLMRATAGIPEARVAGLIDDLASMRANMIGALEEPGPALELDSRTPAP